MNFLLFRRLFFLNTKTNRIFLKRSSDANVSYFFPQILSWNAMRELPRVSTAQAFLRSDLIYSKETVKAKNTSAKTFFAGVTTVYCCFELWQSIKSSDDKNQTICSLSTWQPDVSLPKVDSHCQTMLLSLDKFEKLDEISTFCCKVLSICDCSGM